MKGVETWYPFEGNLSGDFAMSVMDVVKVEMEFIHILEFSSSLCWIIAPFDLQY